MNFYQMLAFFAGFLVIVSSLPQLIKIIKHKSAKDVSLPMFVILLSSNVLWLVYGRYLNDKALIFTSFFAGLISLTNIILITKYQYGKSSN